MIQKFYDYKEIESGRHAEVAVGHGPFGSLDEIHLF